MFAYKQIAWYADKLYGKTELAYSPSKDILFIRTPWDYFKIFLKDKSRFGEYTVMHQNKVIDHDTQTYGWHTQKKCVSLDFAVYMCVTHGFYKEYDIHPDTGEYYKFMNDAKRAWNFERN